MEDEAVGADELQAELLDQLQEQINSLAEVDIALAAGHADDELLQLKAQLEEGITQLRDALTELQQQQQQQQQEQQEQQQQQLSHHAVGSSLPDWMQPGVPCRFRFTDGQWYCGQIHSLLQQQMQQHADQEQPQLPVSVSFSHPTRQYMLHPVQLPVGLVLPAAASEQHEHQQPLSSSNNKSSRDALSVGSRVLALAPGQQLWQQAEVVELYLAASAAGAPAAGSAAGSAAAAAIGSCKVTLVYNGQSVILPLSAVAFSALAEVEHAELDAAAAAAAATAADDSANSSGSGSSDMSISGSSDEDDGNGVTGASSGEDEEAGEEGEEQGYARLGLGGGVLEHARVAAAAGVAQDSASFADWEAHSRGIASRLLTRMGFRKGGGLGKTGAGIAAPLEINILPSKKGLGAVPQDKLHKAHGTGSSKHNKHKSKHCNRGGERTRRRKAAAARHAAKLADGDRQAHMDAATGSEGLFAFINFNLGAGSEAAEKLRGLRDAHHQEVPLTGGAAALASASAAAAAGRSGGGGSSSRHQQQQQQQQQKRQRQQQQQQPDRKILIGSQDDLTAAKARVSHLTAMLSRNKSNRGLAPQIEAKLAAAQREYAAAAAQHRQMHKAVAAKEAADKWAKF